MAVRGAALGATLTACALACGACGSRHEATTGEGSGAAVSKPTRDVSPPAFGGPSRVELIGLETYLVRWEAAQDDVTPPGGIRYQIFHVTEPFGGPDADGQPLLTTEPGVTSARVELDSGPGRFFVRAEDAAGNVSKMEWGLAQRSRRPWTRAGEESVLASINDCSSTLAGQGVCAGQDGYFARWDGGQWRPVAVPTSANLRLLKVTDTLTTVTSDAGHLFEIDQDGALKEVLASFGLETPAPPVRQLAVDAFGLDYWLDGAGVTWVGADFAFRRMNQPLALLDPKLCPSLRALGFGERLGVAVCADGAVYSASLTEPGMKWLPLTASTAAEFAHGATQVVAMSESTALVLEPNAVRLVGVGGWKTLLGPPGDITVAEGQPRVERVGRAVQLATGVAVPTNLGLYWVTPDGVTLVPGAAGDVRGVFDVTGDANDLAATLVLEDGSVVKLAGGARTLLTPVRQAGFVAGATAADGTVVALHGGAGAGASMWTGGSWHLVVPGFPGQASGQTVVRMASRGQGSTVLVASNAGGHGAVWSGTTAGWAAMPTAALALSPAPKADDQVTFTAPPPVAPAASGSPPAMEPVVDLDVSADGRGVLVTEHQMWWLAGGTWVYLGERPGPMHGVALDAGETFVLHEGKAVTRCWRATCGSPVQPPALAPATALTSWRSHLGLVVVSESGQTLLFATGTASAPRDSATPAADTPPGSFAESGAPLVPRVAELVRQRLTGQAFDVMLRSDNMLLQNVDGAWIAQAEVPDAVALVPEGDSWAVATARGLLTLARVDAADHH